MIHLYTYGKNSKQFMLLTRRQAQYVNDFSKAFFEAQARFLEENGRPWHYTESISIDLTPELQKGYNKVATWLNWQHPVRNWIFKLFRIDVSKEEFEDFLVKRI